MKPACLVTLILALSTYVADSPYAGTWKVTLQQQKSDLTFWLLDISKDGQKITVLSGLGLYAKSKVSDIKSTAKELSFTLSGPTTSYLIVEPPSTKEPNVMYGSIQSQGNLYPIWLTRTNVQELTPKNAVRDSVGFKELEEVAKLGDESERRRKRESILTNHPTRPVVFFVLQQILQEQVRDKARAEEIQKTVDLYRQNAARHGELFLLGANLDLSRFLLGQKGAEKVVLETAQQAVDLLRSEYTPALHLTARLVLAEALVASGQEDQTKALAEQILRSAEAIIQTSKEAEETLATTGNLANELLKSRADAVVQKGLELARRTVKLIKPDTPVQQRATAYRLLEAALKKRGLDDEAEELAPTLDRIEDELDVAYEKEMLSFKLEKVGPRKSNSDRVVLVELFTNAPNRQVVAATIAFDAARKTYPPTEVAFLQYHVMFPEADSLVFPDGELRKLFYMKSLEGLPGVYVDGKPLPPLGGAKHRGKNSYDLLREAIDKARNVEPGAKLSVTLTRSGELLTAKADVANLKEAGAKIRLRFALVEERIRYAGTSSVRLHHHVVRAFLGGAGGLQLTRNEQTLSASLNLAQLRQILSTYLDGLAKKAGVSDPVKPLALEKLKVIAWIQDEDTKEVLATAQVDVPSK